VALISKCSLIGPLEEENAEESMQTHSHLKSDHMNPHHSFSKVLCQNMWRERTMGDHLTHMAIRTEIGKMNVRKNTAL